jgi:tetratricopeptide (TPR) repeat protein
VQENLSKALALAATGSEGERLTIQASQAGFNRNPQLEEELLRKVTGLYPEDKRCLLLLGNCLSGQRRYEEARTTYRKAIALDPDFAPAYNLLGYVDLYTGDLTEAEHMFRKYVDLIPNEPNPHDSYAELLMKMGRYDESIAAYEKAISLDEQFYSSHIGLAYDYVFKGQYADARRQLQAIDETTSDAGVKSLVIDASTAIALHEGKYDRALESAQQGYSLALKSNDTRAIVACQLLMGDIMLEANAVDNTKRTSLKSRSAEPSRVLEAAKHIDEAEHAITAAVLPDDTRISLSQAVRARNVEVALRNSDVAAARRIADEYRTTAMNRRSGTEIEHAHELAGRIAMTENRLQEAVTELHQANLRDPRNLYRLMEVYDALGDKVMVNDLKQRVTAFNETGINYAFVRRLAMP